MKLFKARSDCKPSQHLANCLSKQPLNLPPDFDWRQYLANYRDLCRAGITDQKGAEEHWCNFGQQERRTYKRKHMMVIGARVRRASFLLRSLVAEKSRGQRCRHFPAGISILSDGSVSTCCFDSWGRNRFGSIWGGNLTKIWQTKVKEAAHNIAVLPGCKECIAHGKVTLGDPSRREIRRIIRTGPKTIFVEPMACCNYDCCDSNTMKGLRSETKADLERVFVQIRPFLPSAERLIPFLAGEPLLHPDFCDFIRKCRSRAKSLEIIVSTNGMLLERDIAQCFVKERVDQVIVSVHGGPGTGNLLRYAKRGANYEKVLENTSRLITLRNERKK